MISKLSYQYNISVIEGLASLSSPTLAGAKIDTQGLSFGAVVNALANNSNANLLSTPSILTLDNQEAKILVGREVPFRTGSFSTTGDGTSNPFTTVNRQDVGIELVVTPHVFENNDVRMEILQKITNVATFCPLAQWGNTSGKINTQFVQLPLGHNNYLLKEM